MRKDSNLLSQNQLKTMKTIALNTQQTMTSLEIAELTGKQHKNVMQAIRNMEHERKKTCGLKFQLTSRTIVQPNGGKREVPCYQLTKTECLYIATKFNDEARAKLVLRWQELEESSRFPSLSSRLSVAHGEISRDFLRPSGSKRAELERSTSLEVTVMSAGIKA